LFFFLLFFHENIAGILAMNPEIMILDEPTYSLDLNGASQVLKLLYGLNKEGITIIISTHDVEYDRLTSVIIKVQKKIIPNFESLTVYC
jgi:cobalt/nickel transport system ATP-binding protein